MEEMIQTNYDENEVKALAAGKYVPVKKWDHLAIRPTTFENFNRLNTLKSADAFVLELLDIYEKRLAFLEKKRLEAKK
jgi:hypothetical protein